MFTRFNAAIYTASVKLVSDKRKKRKKRKKEKKEKRETKL